MIFLSDFNQIWHLKTDFHTSPYIKFNRNPSGRIRVDTCGETDMTQLIDTVNDHSNVLERNRTETCAGCSDEHKISMQVK